MLDENCEPQPCSNPSELADNGATDDEGKDFVWMAVDGIARVFEMNVSLLLSSQSIV